MKLFSETPITQFFKIKTDQIQKAIEVVNQHRFATESVPAIAQSIVDQFKLDQLLIDWESRKVQVSMREVKEQDIFSQGGRGVSTAKKAYVLYSYNIKTGGNLLIMQPSTRNMQHKIDFSPSGHSLYFGYQTRHSNEHLSEEVKAEVKSAMKQIIDELPLMQDAINKDVEAFNEELKPQILEALEQRKQIFERLEQQKSDLNDFK